MKIRNKLSLIVISLMIIAFTMPNYSNAALQANGASIGADSVTNWFVKIRSMEATGGTLGLIDTINAETLEGNTTNPNNLDIHLSKNTEFGAMSILATSAYGNQNKIATGGTTTGNKSGIYINLNREWVAAGNLSSQTRYVSASGKYKNIYTTAYARKNGDTITETSGWHGSGSSVWLTSDAESGLVRALSGSIFSYNGHHNAGSGQNFGKYSNKNAARAVIVVGNGF